MSSYVMDTKFSLLTSCHDLTFQLRGGGREHTSAGKKNEILRQHKREDKTEAENPRNELHCIISETSANDVSCDIGIH